jgi:hypothetical protein
MRISWRAIWTRRVPNWWLAVGVPTLAMFGSDFILRIAFDSATLLGWFSGRTEALPLSVRCGSAGTGGANIRICRCGCAPLLRLTEVGQDGRR